MKSFLALIFTLASIVALSSASDRKTQVLGKCDAKVFVKLAEEAVSDAFDLSDSLSASYEQLFEGVLQCLDDYTDVVSLVSCVGDTLTAWVVSFSDAWQTFSTELIALGVELTDDIASCQSSATI